MQTLLGHIERWLAYSQAPLEDCAGEKEVREQLKFENLVPEEKKTPEIIPILPILPGELQPRKVEEVLPNDNIVTDTYLIYPNGGYHPFYGISNTLPRYQEKIWPYAKRIKFSETFKSQARLDRVRRSNLRENHTIEQINPYWNRGYYSIMIKKNSYFIRSRYTDLKKNGEPSQQRERNGKRIPIHRLVALAFIPNPENKPFVMHINDDPTNYLIENLKWGTHSENMRGTLNKRPDTMEQKYLSLVNQGVIKG